MSTTGTISSSTGLASGIDYNTLLQKLRQADSGPVTLAQQSQQKLQTQQQAMAAIQKAVLDFQSKSQALQSQDTFLSMTATTTDGSVLLANATNTATPGSYGVQVKQLAAADRLAGQGIASPDNTSIANAAGKLSFNVGGGTQIDVNVTAGETLNQLRDAINNAGTSVSASVVNDGSGSDPYRLVLTATDTGAANKINIVHNDTSVNLTGNSISSATAAAANTFNGTITSSGTYTGQSTQNIILQVTTGGAVGTAKYKASYDGGLTWTANDAFTTSASAVDVTGTAAQGVDVAFGAGTTDLVAGDTFSMDAFAPHLQTAQDAIIAVNGVQISRGSNTIDDAINGVTLTARKVDTDIQTVQVLNSNSAVAGKVSDFVNSYNALVATVKQQTSYDTTSNTAAPLFGDSGVSSLVESFRESIADAVPGLPSDLTMNSIGVSVDATGALTFDSAAFNTALNKNLSGVTSLFVQAAKSTNSDIQYVSATSDSQIGSYAVNITQAAEQATVSGGQVLTGGLAADETLTVSDANASAIITLNAGSTLASVISQLNDTFATKNLGLTASNDGGKLRLTTTDYGKDQVVRVVSNQAAGAAGQLGIGPSPLTDTGVDVAGTIGGAAATGDGRTLQGNTGPTKGLQLTITANQPTTGTVTLSRGVAQQLVDQMTALTDPTNGLFATRNTSYNTQITDLGTRIDDLNTRLDAEQATMQKKFNDLESELASLQQQGNFLQSQLASLVTTTSSSSL